MWLSHRITSPFTVASGHAQLSMSNELSFSYNVNVILPLPKEEENRPHRAPREARFALHQKDKNIALLFWVPG